MVAEVVVLLAQFHALMEVVVLLHVHRGNQRHVHALGLPLVRACERLNSNLLDESSIVT
ncbi:MAG: hypothetical protein BKPUNTRY_001282 [Candidatus Fervidibacter sp.]